MIHQYIVFSRYAETDMMGIIHHSVYPIWAEAARTDLMIQMGYSYSEIEKTGIMLPVTEIQFQYKAPAVYEKEIKIETIVSHLDNRRLRLDYTMTMDNKVCCIGYSKHVFMNAHTRMTMRISSELLENFKKFYHPELKLPEKNNTNF